MSATRRPASSGAMAVRSLTAEHGPAPGVPGSTFRRATFAPRSVDEAYRNFLSLGEACFGGGPESDAAAQVAAWPAVRAYLWRHREALLLRGLSLVELDAGDRLCAELAACLEERRWEPLLPPPPVWVVMDAIAQLEHLRAAVIRSGREEDAATFGVWEPVAADDPGQVAEAIERFLQGAAQNLERLPQFQMVGMDLDELRLHRRALWGDAGDGESARARGERLQAAVSGLYASLRTVIQMAFGEADGRRREGLARFP